MAKEEIQLHWNGFLVKFANGYSASVRWGKGNYVTHDPMIDDIASSVEIAVFDPEGEFVRDTVWINDNDDVKGHVSISDIPHFLEYVRTEAPYMSKRHEFN